MPRGYLNRWHDGNHSGQRVLRVEGLLETMVASAHRIYRMLSFQLALQESDIALWILVGGYVGEGEDRKPADTGRSGGSSICGAADPLCLFAPWAGENNTVGTSASTPQVAAALDTVWTVWPDMDILDLRNLAFDCAENMAAPEGETATTPQLLLQERPQLHVRHQLPLGPRHPEPDLPVHAERRPAESSYRQRDLRRDLRAPGRPCDRRIDHGRGLHRPGISGTGLPVRSLARTSLWPQRRI